MSFIERVQESLFTPYIGDQTGFQYMLGGLGITLQLTFFAIILGTVIGVVTAFLRIGSPHGLDTIKQISRAAKSKGYPVKMILSAIVRYIGRKIADLYIWIIRGTPVVAQLTIIYFVIFASVDVSQVLVGIVAFGLNSGAYISEIVRAGIQAVDKGQTEASRSLGISSRSTMTYIILPQAIKNILPALGNEFIVLLKETAVVGMISLVDLMFAASKIRAKTYEAFIPLITAALMYLFLTTVMAAVLKYFERRLQNSD